MFGREISAVIAVLWIEKYLNVTRQTRNNFATGVQRKAGNKLAYVPDYRD
jgi:hypothetical protein